MFIADYLLTDRARDPVALFVWQNYVNALQQSGAKLVSDPRAHNRAILTHEAPTGTFWYIYDHTSGNDDATGTYRLTTEQVAPMRQNVQVRDTTALLDTQDNACKDPPWLVRQFDYFRLSHCDTRDFDSITLRLPGGDKTLAGHILRTDYVQSDKSRTPVTAVLRDNYVNTLQSIGARLVSDPHSIFQAVLTRPTPQGKFRYIYAHTRGNDQSTGSYSLTTVQVGGPTQKACTLEVYGVNFDFDKATLRPDSTPVLNQVLALFSNDAAYAAEIGGHTDNIGQRAYNRTLSSKRAEAVKIWLVNHGASGVRITTAGYGDSRPLVPNTTDENRFRNRRVELRRKACT